MALAFTACDEGTPPPVEPPPPPTPVGTISGSVTIEGTAAAGITATLSSGATTTTGSGGNFAFSGVEAGTYTVTISGFPEDATFAQVTQSATIATDGQNVQLNFAGEYVRSSAVVGSVVAADAMMSGGDGQPETLAGVTVTLDGEHAMGETMETDMSGGFAFTGLRAGTYTVTISDFPEDVSFETVSVEVEVEVGEVGQADFTGHYIRTSAVEGQVIIDGEGLAAVTVTLIGGPAEENFTMMTDADGMYRFEDLRPGDYTVSISDFDTRDYEFAATSQDVSVDLDETGTVSFTGVLLRTSSISGRVSVEGMGLDGIAVTLSGGDTTRTEMTADGGQFAFAGLAAGDYTVTIAVDNPAYVFGEMSKAVTVGDDDSQIVPFDGQHARTASVSGQFFIDELNKNNMMDAGEHPLPAPDVQVVLVGPGVNQQTSSQTGPDGSFMFSGLRAGVYQLVVPIDATVAAALAAEDVAYGGEGAGYPVTLGVGEAKSQNIPFDITHTTVNFSVSLKSGEEMGDALPGASVQLYGTGNAMVGSGMTGDDGSVAIKVARAMTSGNMVNAGVSAEGYDVADGMTAVSWDPQMRATSGSNSNDIVNLNVDVSINGRTVETGHPDSGQPLAGWAISVMVGDAAVADAPAKLDAEGMASLKTTVESVPATFTFAVADDQENELDGGESYEGSGGTYVHDGLSLAGTVDADDPMVVTYTTQTLKVFVHHEVDQAHGYTGNVGHGDTRKSGLVDLRVVRPGTGSLTRSLSGWDGEDNTSDDKKGGYTFKHLPVDEDIVVLADARDGYKLLAPHRLDTYRNFDDNGVAGSAFGDHGGWGHTVMLCPLQATDPTGQDFDECGSFAVVATHDVSVTVSKMRVRMAASGSGFNAADPSSTNQPDITVSLTPVEGKNLAGEGESFTSTTKNKGAHDFGAMAAGTYEVGVPEGWRGMSGEESAASAFSPLDGDVELTVTPTTATVYGVVRAKAPQDPTEPGLANVTVAVGDKTTQTDDAGRYIISDITAGKVTVKATRAGYPDAKNEFASLAANTVTRSDFDLSGSNNTVTISGRVTEQGTDNGIEGVVITVDGSAPLNAATAGDNAGKLVTGDDGTYEAIVNATDPTTDPTVEVKPTAAGWNFIPASLPVSGINGGTNVNFQGWKTTKITGMVLGVMPFGATTRPPMADVVVTATWQGVAPGKGTVTTKADGIFVFDVPTLAGSVEITAAPVAEAKLSPTRADYPRVRDAARYVWFDPPSNRPGGSVVFIPGQPTVHFGSFTAQSVQPRITKVERVAVKDAFEGDVTASAVSPNAAGRTAATHSNATGFLLVRGEPTDTIKVTWAYETRNPYATSSPTAAANAYSADNTGVDATGAAANNNPTAVGAGVAPVLGVRDEAVPPAWTSTAATTRLSAKTATTGTTVSHTRTTTLVIPDANDLYYDEIDLRIGNAVVDANGTARTNAVALSVAVGKAGVDNTVSELSARVAPPPAGTPENHHLIDATWKASGSPQMEQRVALWVGGLGVDNDEEGWLIVPTAALTITRSTTFGGTFARWSMADINLSTVDDTDASWITENLGVAVLNLDRVDLLNASRLLVQTRAHSADDWQSVAVDISGR